MLSQAPIATPSVTDIDAALRHEIATAGAVLPLVTLTSAEHGPLVVMRASDMAVVLAYLRRPRPTSCLS